MRDFLKKDITPYVIGGFVIILCISIYLSINTPLSYKMDIKTNPVVGSPVTVNFEVQKQMTHYSPQTFNIELTHKYNSNDTYKFDIDPYADGYYEIVFTPSYSGAYLVKITMEIDGKTQYFTEEISVEQ